MISLSVLLGLVGFSTLLLFLCTLFVLGWTLTRPFRASAAQAKLADYPFVSILVPFYNEPEASFLRTLEAIEATAYPGKLEVILIDDGSNNTTPAFLDAWLQHARHKSYVRVSLQENSGAKGRALDAALPLISADSDVVTVIDSDTVILPNALRIAVEALYASPSHAAVCGLIVPEDRHLSWLHRLQFYEYVGAPATIRFVQSKMGMVNVVSGAFSLHRTAVIRKLGGWGEWLVEDISWTWRALAHGYTIGYAPDAIAYTVCPDTWLALFRQRRRWARGRLESFGVAWRISRTNTVKMLPWWLLWAQAALLPTLLLCIAGAWLYRSEYLFGVALANWVLMIVLNGLACLQVRSKLKLRWIDIVLISVYNTGIDTLLLPANLIGLTDEFRGHHKTWLTR